VKSHSHYLLRVLRRWLACPVPDGLRLADWTLGLMYDLCVVYRARWEMTLIMPLNGSALRPSGTR